MIIYPPVAVEDIQRIADWRTNLRGDELRALETLPQQFILGASRFVSYKHLDWVIRLGNTSDVPVVIAGDRPEQQHLQRWLLKHMCP